MATYTVYLRAGAPISALNTVRRHLSRIAGEVASGGDLAHDSSTNNLIRRYRASRG